MSWLLSWKEESLVGDSSSLRFLQTTVLFVVSLFSDLVIEVEQLFHDSERFETKLLKLFLGVLLLNIILIFAAWKHYGRQISERFMRTVSSKTLEEFKRDATLLKLPKEHSPRI